MLHEVVIDNENGKFFQVSKIETIVKAFQFFIDNPLMRKSFGEKSLQNFKSKFQESTNNYRLFELYQRLQKV